MKKWKSALIIITFVLLLSVFFFFVPLDGIVKNIPIIKNFYQNTTLEITTPNGKALVKIDGKEYGETPSNITNLVAGKYEIELIRTSQSEGFYKSHMFNIELTKNSTARINMEIGPDDNLHGVVLYYTQDKTIENGKGKITITSDASDTKVYVNNEFLKNAPVANILLDKGEYSIRLVTNDFEDLEFPMVVREGHILNIKGYQFPIPVNFELSESNE